MTTPRTRKLLQKEYPSVTSIRTRVDTDTIPTPYRPKSARTLFSESGQTPGSRSRALIEKTNTADSGKKNDSRKRRSSRGKTFTLADELSLAEERSDVKRLKTYTPGAEDENEEDNLHASQFNLDLLREKTIEQQEALNHKKQETIKYTKMIESLQAEKEKLTTAVKRIKQEFDKMKCVYPVDFYQ